VSALETPLCELLGVRYPIVQTGMGWVSGARLTAATCEAGAMGILASATMTLPELRVAIGKVKARTSNPFGVNLLPNQADLLDRIDLMIEVPAVPEADLAMRGAGEASAVIRERVTRARATQIERQGKANALLTPEEIDRHCLPDCAGAQLLKQAMARLDLSARAYHRILKVARTVADLAGAMNIGGPHVAEAIHYRRGFG